MSWNTAPTPIIQGSIPVRYDPRVVVKPCEPGRVPFLPFDVLQLIAKALPQPKQVFNLALADKGTWQGLQPALYECEVTYEARLAHKYQGQSSICLQEEFPDRMVYGVDFAGEDSDSDDLYASDTDSDLASEDSWFGTSIAGESDEHDDEGADPVIPPDWICPCRICNGRIHIEPRLFEAPMPDIEQQYRLTGAMTALHWALMQGTSALPVARKAIEAARVHQPSYVSGVDLVKRHYRECENDPVSKLVPANLPPPLFLAVAHENLDICRELIDAGADLNLMRGQTRCGQWPQDGYGDPVGRQRPALSFQIHKECVQVDGLETDCMCDWSEEWSLVRGSQCQTVGHVAIDLGATSILQLLVQSGLKVWQESYSLIHYAVRDGNLAAVRVLLDHDSSLTSTRLHGRTPMHFVPLMRRKTGRDVRDGILEGMVSHLLECGAVLEAPAQDGGDISAGQTPLDSAVKSLYLASGGSFWRDDLDDIELISAQHAAHVFITLGADWTQAHVESPYGRDPENILEALLEMTISVPVESMYADIAGEGQGRASREIRKGWGQMVKTIVTKVSECLAEGNNAQKRATFEAAISSAFTWIASCDRDVLLVGKFAVEALWKLLLSTGIRPDDETMQTWEALPSRCRSRGLPEYLEIDAELGDMEGDRSEWEFLLAGVNTQDPVPSSPTEDCVRKKFY